MSKQSVRFQLRRRTKQRWEELNEVLLDGEPGIEVDPSGPERMKIGDGETPWIELPYFTGSSGEFSNPELLAHIEDPEPHPQYDDGSSLILLYENAKV